LVAPYIDDHAHNHTQGRRCSPLRSGTRPDVVPGLPTDSPDLAGFPRHSPVPARRSPNRAGAGESAALTSKMEQGTMTTHPPSCSREGSGVTAVALVLIAAGVLLLLDNFGILWIDRVWNLWPVTLIAVGVAELIHWGKERLS